MHSAIRVVARCHSVCLSVRPSSCAIRYCVKTAKCIVESPKDSLIILVLRHAGVIITNEGAK